MNDVLAVRSKLRRTAAVAKTAGKRAALLDAFDGAMFRARAGERRAARAEYLAIASPSDFLDFARTRFPGPFSQFPEEILPFLEHAAAASPRTVAEIGTQFGGTNFLLSQALPTVTTMAGIDLFVRNRARLKEFRRPGQALHLIEGSSHDAETRMRLATALGNSELDVLFIDGDHSWAGVTQDFSMYRGLVADGGLIVFHDIVPDARLRHGTTSAAFAGDVPVFWPRVKDLYDHREFVRDWDQEGCGIGVIDYDSSVTLPDGLFVL